MARQLLWCTSCMRNQQVVTTNSFICCNSCGKILDDTRYTNQPISDPNATWQQRQLAENFVTIVIEVPTSQERRVEHRIPARVIQRPASH